jgi:hypothetical protein
MVRAENTVPVRDESLERLRGAGWIAEISLPPR